MVQYQYSFFVQVALVLHALLQRFRVRVLPRREPKLCHGMPWPLTMARRRNRALVVICILLILSSTDRRQKRNRFYPTRKLLPPDARAGTAWQFIYSSRNGHSFILTMGLSVRLFELTFLLALLKPGILLQSLEMMFRLCRHTEELQVTVPWMQLVHWVLFYTISILLWPTTAYNKSSALLLQPVHDIVTLPFAYCKTHSKDSKVGDYTARFPLCLPFWLSLSNNSKGTFLSASVKFCDPGARPPRFFSSGVP